MAADDWCPVCGRDNTWGCGHDSRQRAAARRHNASEAHQRGRCHHFDHRTCKKGECFKAGIDTSRPGWVPLMTHQQQEMRYRESMPSLASPGTGSVSTKPRKDI